MTFGLRAPVRATATTAMLLSIAVVAGCAASDADSGSSPGSASAAPPREALERTPTPSAAPLEHGLAPTAITIDAIDLTAPLIDLGLTPDGTMQVPADYDAVGWFTGGGRPGGHGPLVIAAHVDSPTGPAAFVRLRELVPGDLVEVTDTAGELHTYRLTEAVAYPKAEFPTARVFGAVRPDELRLITCGGVFDSSAGSYEDNLVIYGVRADG